MYFVKMIELVRDGDFARRRHNKMRDLLSEAGRLSLLWNS